MSKKKQNPQSSEGAQLSLFGDHTESSNHDIKNSDNEQSEDEKKIEENDFSENLTHFYTPQHIVKMIKEIINPKKHETILDPACGTGVTLGSNGSLSTLNGISNFAIESRNSLSDQNTSSAKFSVILGNPPYSGSSHPWDTISNMNTNTIEGWISYYLQKIKVSGRFAVVVPESFLFGSSKAHKLTRIQIIEDHKLQAVVSLHAGVIQSYSGVSAILFFTRTDSGGTDHVWFYDMQNDGFSLNAKREPIDENDIPDLLTKWKNRDHKADNDRTSKCFFVPKSEIVENDYSLSINRYRETKNHTSKRTRDFHNLLKEWHPVKNKHLNPKDYRPGSRTIVWWKCRHSPDHEWKAPIRNRSNNRGCPMCPSKSVSISNSLQNKDPRLALEWHPVLNSFTPREVCFKTEKKYFWKCRHSPDHEWKAIVSSRVGGRGCPSCAGKETSITNKLCVQFPDLALEWHPIKNTSELENIRIGSDTKVWWKCRHSPDHEWQATVPSRTKQGSGCPMCKGRGNVSITTSLSMLFPSIAQQLHPTKNKGLSAIHIKAGEHRDCWWKCSKSPDHEWKTRVDHRTGNGSKCSFCGHQKVSLSNSLLVQYPEIAAQWDHEKNTTHKLETISKGSNKKVWWKCSKGHSWKIKVSSRTTGTGCPTCNSGWTLDNVRDFVQSLYPRLHCFTQAELYLIFQQSGLLKTTGQARGFGKAVISGKIPVEELEKFANNEPSEVDNHIGKKSGQKPDTENHDEIIQSNLTEQEIDITSAHVLPFIETNQALEVLDFQMVATSDEEAIDFLIASAKAKLWTHAYSDVSEAKKQAEEYKGGEYSTRVKEEFLNELRAALDLEIPIGYSFKVKGKVDSKLGYTPPLLMQRLCSVRVRDNKRYGNWSGTGAGKTISAILSTRVVGSKLTVICCPNAVVENWKVQIEKVFPDSDVQFRTWEPEWLPNSKYRYLIQNFEQFQQRNSEAYIKHFIDREQVEFVVIDEIHYAKQRYKEKENSEKSNVSRRKKLVQGLIAGVSEQNPNLYVLGMSATPVINNLFEGISLLEMMMGQEYSDLSDRPTINNCMRLYQQLVTNGTRWVPDYSSMKLNRKVVDIDCSEYVPEIRALGKTPSPLSLEKILTQARLPTILEHILPNKKTLIYTHYVDDIDLALCDAIREKGFKVGFYTGKDKTGLKGFLHGDIDVLIGSSSIGTGVDGLQDVCNTLIINVLPWTNAEYEQLRGRIYRQGSSFHNIDIIIPLTYADIGGERWSYCESKWKRILFKKSIADAAVDGVVPDGNLRTPTQAQKDLLQWLERLDSGDVEPIRRRKITVPLSGEFKDVERRKRKYGDFSTMNGRWNHSKSQTLGERLAKDPEEWGQYHTLYQEARKNWTVVPFEEMITWLKNRQGYEVGDFGCGEALLAKEIGDLHTVHSFDHVAINDSVTACDMSKTPLEDGSLNVAIFSLSLMGANFTDYLREAWRVLKVDGSLHIWEATSRFGNTMDFVMNLNKLGFDPKFPKERGKFTYITATKIVSEPDRDFKLKF